ncbi:MAG: cryptochrome/photolyase family protein [Chitinispirillaceae bacterium]
MVPLFLGRGRAYVLIDGRGSCEMFAAMFADVLAQNSRNLKPETLWIIRPGEYRALDEVTETTQRNQCRLKMWEDDHFYYSPHRFGEYESGEKQLLMERFYHKIRQENDILMEGVAGDRQAGRLAAGACGRSVRD